jgi:3-hydroxyisobutyrate dehydrogenase-like beta-hydroxyacid dehydrogenase
MNIGMVGIGLMGLGIATNLQKHAHALNLLDHPGNQSLDALLAGGATKSQCPRDVAATSEVIILCVTGTPQVEAVLLDTDGVLSGLRPNTIIIDCSTAVPSSTERLAQLVRKGGGRFLDAPMTRTPKEAAEGRLNLLVGGERQLFDECYPVLRCFAENIMHAGPTGAGHRMKLLHNYVSLGMVALLAEAGACALRAGIEPSVFVEILAKGGGHGAALDRLKPYMLQHDSSALRFTLRNAQKDLGYYNTMASETGAAHGIAESIFETLTRAVADGGENAFLPELVALLKDINTKSTQDHQ